MKLLGCLILTVVLAFGQVSAEVELRAAMHKEQVEGDLKGAIEAYRRIVAKHSGNRSIAAQAMLQMAQCHEKLGESEALKIYQQLVKNYADQVAVAAQARAKLARAGSPNGGQLSVRREEPPKPGCLPPTLGSRLRGCLIEGSLIVVDMTTGKEYKVAGGSHPRAQLAPGGGSPDGVHFAYTVYNQQNRNELYLARPGEDTSRNLGEVGAFLN